ncbi:MAG: hypothetical protein SFT81_07215 [Candidatus Caenarcaniphilales bacterium]|nr:hypothetical protein [Candidatus Caenarcaniphilales bacterium]
MKIFLIIVGVLLAIVLSAFGFLAISLDQSPIGTLVRAHEAACKHDADKLNKEINIEGICTSFTKIPLMMVKKELDDKASQYPAQLRGQIEQLVAQQTDTMKKQLKDQVLKELQTFNSDTCNKLTEIYLGGLIANVALRDGTYGEYTFRKIEAGSNKIDYSITSSDPDNLGTVIVKFVKGDGRWILAEMDFDQTMFETMVKKNTIKVPEVQAPPIPQLP